MHFVWRVSVQKHFEPPAMAGPASIEQVAFLGFVSGRGHKHSQERALVVLTNVSFVTVFLPVFVGMRIPCDFRKSPMGCPGTIAHSEPIIVAAVAKRSRISREFEEVSKKNQVVISKSWDASLQPSILQYTMENDHQSHKRFFFRKTRLD